MDQGLAKSESQEVQIDEQAKRVVILDDFGLSTQSAMTKS